MFAASAVCYAAGITALVVSLCFFISLFFTPLIASVPPYATGPALILVRLLLFSVAPASWATAHKFV
jgi:AGZA family xanthine/uracil permease-like MFS transporter